MKYRTDARLELAKALKRVRRKNGLTQKDIAREMGYTTPQFISNWERGLSLPPLRTVGHLLTFLDIDHDEEQEIKRLMCELSKDFILEEIEIGKNKKNK